MARAFLVRQLITASTASQSKQHLRARFHSRSALLSDQMSHAEQKAALRQTVKQELRNLSVEVMTKQSKKYTVDKKEHTANLAGVIRYCRSSCTNLVLGVGQAIAQRIVHCHFFQQAKTVGIYLHCVKLKEVDTTPIVSAAVQAGQYFPLVFGSHHVQSSCHQAKDGSCIVYDA